MDLNEALREAVAAPPPTSIDLDVLIKSEHRRERQQRWLGGIGITAGVAATVGVVAVGFAGTLPGPFAGGGAPPCPVVSPELAVNQSPDGPNMPVSPAPGASSTLVEPSTPDSSRLPGSPLLGSRLPGSPDWSGEPSLEPSGTTAPTGPMPTENCGTAARRFNKALTSVLHRLAPTAKLTNGDNSRKAAIWFQQYGGDFFNANVVMRDGDDRGNTLNISIESYATVPSQEQACAHWADGACDYERKADGTVVIKFKDGQFKYLNIDGSIAYAQVGPPEENGSSVYVYRPDGTLVRGSVYPWISTKPIASVLASPGASATSQPRRTLETDMKKPILSADQLAEIVQTPDFTLFP